MNKCFYNHSVFASSIYQKDYIHHYLYEQEWKSIFTKYTVVKWHEHGLLFWSDTKKIHDKIGIFPNKILRTCVLLNRKKSSASDFDHDYAELFILLNLVCY